MKRNKVIWYLKIAKVVGEKSSCSRKKYGAILVRNDAILATGYNGTVRGAINCGKDIPCLKNLYDEPSYISYQYCPVIHAEVNAILNAARNGVSVLDSTLFLARADNNPDRPILEGGRPCIFCRRNLINAGVKDCYYMNIKGEITYEKTSLWIKMDNDWMKRMLKERKK